jgi:hypothetical protein
MATNDYAPPDIIIGSSVSTFVVTLTPPLTDLITTSGVNTQQITITREATSSITETYTVPYSITLE